MNLIITFQCKKATFDIPPRYRGIKLALLPKKENATRNRMAFVYIINFEIFIELNRS